MENNYKWNDIELFEDGECAIVWHPIRFLITDNSKKDGKIIVSLRLIPGDEITILEGYKSKYECKENIPIPQGGLSIASINYFAFFRHARGFISSAGIKHKDESKNIGPYMHTQLGWTI